MKQAMNKKTDASPSVDTPDTDTPTPGDEDTSMAAQIKKAAKKLPKKTKQAAAMNPSSTKDIAANRKDLRESKYLERWKILAGVK